MRRPTPSQPTSSAASEDARHLLASAVDYASFLLDLDGNVASWNAGASRLKGYDAGEIIGRHFSRFFPSEDVLRGKPDQELAAARAAGQAADEGWRVRKDGTRYWANVVVTALHDDTGRLRGYAKVTHDLTERKRAEENLQEAEKRFQELLATVSHELRTPLNAIVGWAEMLLNRGLEQSIAHPIEVIHRNARAQARIIEDILDISRIDAGKLRLEPKPTDIVALARDVIEAMRIAASEKPLTVELVAPVQAFVIGDPERLQQVVWNLLSNALKFTDAPGRIAVRVAQDATGTLLSVSDTGRGIDAELLPRVFERFRQGESATRRHVNGLGLGLSLVKHIVQLHGGSVTANSEGEGKGATFTIRLPATGGDPVAPPAADPAPRP